MPEAARERLPPGVIAAVPSTRRQGPAYCRSRSSVPQYVLCTEPCAQNVSLKSVSTHVAFMRTGAVMLVGKQSVVAFTQAPTWPQAFEPLPGLMLR